MYAQIARNKRKTILLIVLFVALLGILGYVFDRLLGGSGSAGIIFALILSWGMALISYYSGDRIALATSGARPLAKEDNPYVYRMVENLCITAGLPLPKIYIVNDPALNAFATGRDPTHSSIALTTGIIGALENEELEGVIAHELSHVKNYDIRVMTIVIVLVGAVALLADFFLRAQFFGLGGRGRNREGGGSAFAFLMIAGLVLAILSPLIAQLIQLAVSRKREYLADASGALLTRYPEGLARALEKIGQNARPLTRKSNATAHLWIANPFGNKRTFAALFATHPPIEKRIKALREMGT